jgi:hypothetical protein
MTKSVDKEFIIGIMEKPILREVFMKTWDMGKGKCIGKTKNRYIKEAGRKGFRRDTVKSLSVTERKISLS